MGSSSNCQCDHWHRDSRGGTASACTSGSLSLPVSARRHCQWHWHPNCHDESTKLEGPSLEWHWQNFNFKLKFSQPDSKSAETVRTRPGTRRTAPGRARDSESDRSAFQLELQVEVHTATGSGKFKLPTPSQFKLNLKLLCRTGSDSTTGTGRRLRASTLI